MHDTRRKAAFVARMAASLRHFLDAAFEEDGTCTEGIGYWNFGMSWFTISADTLKRYTRGEVDLFSHPKLARIATFPAGADLGNGTFPPYSDCVIGNRADGFLLNYYARLLRDPELAAMAQAGAASRGKGMSMNGLLLAWMAEELPAPPRGAERHAGLSSWLPVSQWLVARERGNSVDGLVLAAKGGHNAECHNHNDVGAFAVFVDGEMAIADPGKPLYDRWFFGPKRYEYAAAGSQGHSVPVVNGRCQRTGRDARAETLSHEDGADRVALTLEIAPAYPPEARIASLKRRLEYSRGSPASICLTDKAAFTGGGNTWEGRLVSLQEWRIEANTATTLDGRLSVNVTTQNVALTRAAEPCNLSGIGETRLHILRLRQDCPGTTGEISLVIAAPRASAPSDRD